MPQRVDEAALDAGKNVGEHENQIVGAVVENVTSTATALQSPQRRRRTERPVPVQANALVLLLEPAENRISLGILHLRQDRLLRLHALAAKPPLVDDRLSPLKTIEEVCVLITALGAFVFDTFVCDLEAIAVARDLQDVTYRHLFRRRGLDHHVDGRGVHGIRQAGDRRRLPQPFLHAAHRLDRRRKLTRRRAQQRKHFQQIRLPGTVRTDQDVQRLQRQVDSFRSEREESGHLDATYQHVWLGSAAAIVVIRRDSQVRFTSAPLLIYQSLPTITHQRCILHGCPPTGLRSGSYATER
ncbi:MAG: hypothetical protein OXK79_01175 [Chloroflexota bacterium]|nr:hypothetical protein [Chloroflexota bacterium]